MKKFSIAIFKIISVIAICAFATLFTSCEKNVSLEKYVSEKRTDVYYCEQNGYTITAFYSSKEYPYLADGIVGALSDFFEIKLKAPDNSLNYNICFTVSGKEISGELSFESVRQIYTFSLSVSRPIEKQIDFKIMTDESEIILTAKNVKAEKTLSINNVLRIIKKSEKNRLNALVQNDIFAGEIYIRLVYKENELFYYVAIFDRIGNSYSLLIDAETGEILATKEN